MAKKFLSLLGTGDYKTCIYKLENKHCTKYVQEALVKEICGGWSNEDEIIIFLTQEARKKHWCNDNNAERSLEGILKEIYPKPNIKDVAIPSGKNENEIWEIFELILSNINEDDEIFFDITNSFRSIPMLVLVVLNYAKAIKSIKLNKIYYGAYEAKTEKDGEDVAPIFDLTPFDSVLEWSESVSSFIKYGNSEKIKELSKKELLGRIKSGDDEARVIRDFVERLNDFTNNIYTCRGKVIANGKGSSRKSIGAAYSMLKENLDDLSKKESNLLKPLKPLLGKIGDRISEFSSDDNLKNGLAVIKWSIDNNLIQQGYTALDETIKTYVCRQYNLDDCTYINREDIVGVALNIRMKKIDKSEWRVVDKNIDLVEKIVNEINQNLIDLCNKIRGKRNDINHFGFKEGISDYETMKRELNKYYDEFKNYIEENFDCKE